jgi:glycosyltransferase involved in cell wall biosynthesis
MLQDHTILCFASGYDAPPTSKHHVMHALAEENVVLWVNYHASRVPSAKPSDLKRIAGKLAQVAAGLSNPRPNLYVLTPLVLPLPTSAWAQRLNRWLLRRQIGRALREVGRGPIQFWTFTPDVGYLLGRFGEQRVVYYCVDEHSAFTGYDSEQVLRDEEQLSRGADLVVATSQSLYESRREWNPNTMLVPHGVDFDHFSQALAADLSVPAEIADIPHPRLGFFGLIRDWVDVDLLSTIARRRPEWHFVMIGDSTVDLSAHRALPNMHFLGPKPYVQLPAYCKGFDVGLIPFKLNELTLAVNPIKLREYLAAGLPVVSTPLPEVSLYEKYVHLAAGEDAFEQAVAKALDSQLDEQLRDARVNAMSRETWPEKVADICAALAGDLTRSQRHMRSGAVTV